MGKNFGMIFLSCVLSVFFSFAQAAEDGGSITGIVLKEGKPAKGVLIVIKGDTGLEKDMLSLEDGSYFFEDIPEGSYVLTLDVLEWGFQNRSEMIFVNSGKQLNLGTKEVFEKNITKTMSDFLISPSLDYVRDENALAFGKSSQYPGTINVVTKEFMEDVFAETAMDVLIQSTPGIFPQSGYDSDFVIRGFRAAAVSVDGMKMPRNRTFTPFPYNFASESIEVIKGSSGFQGVPTPGGMVNYTLKRPHFDRLRGGIKFFSSTVDSKHKIYLDLSGPLDRKVVDGKFVSSVAGRLNVAFIQSSIPNPNLNKTIVALVTSVDVRKKMFSLQMDGLGMFHSGFLDRGVAVPDEQWKNNAKEVSLHRLNKYDDHHKHIVMGMNVVGNFSLPEFITGELRHKVDATAAYRMQVSSENLKEHRSDNKYISKTDKTKIVTKNKYGFHDNESHQIKIEGMYQIKHSNIKNKSKLGMDFVFFKLPYTTDFDSGYYLLPKGAPTSGKDKSASAVPAISDLSNFENWSVKGLSHDLLGGNMPYDPHFAGEGILLPAEKNPVEKGSDNTASWGVYLLNQMELFQWATVLGGVRYDYVLDFKGATKNENVVQQSFSPIAGVVGHVLKNKYGFYGLDLYAGVATGFEPVLIKNWYEGAESGKSFQVDGGVRAKMKNGYYLSLGAYYLREINQRKKNRSFISTKAVDESNRPSIVFPIVDSLGTEFEAKGQVLQGLYLGGVYSWCYKLGDTRPENKSTTKDGGIYISSMPSHSGSIWVKYVIPSTILKGLGARVSFTGFGDTKRPHFSDSPKLGDLPPQYWANASVSYDQKMFSVKVAIENIGGGRVWKSSYSAFRSFPRYDGVAFSANIGMKI